ncbi:ATP-binding protein [Devosia faecipullorum]|uniref:ATP-binding protein n=1 Tax=Devosia faecipullorum TaxID=2755039 RepID=UPI00187B188D|nr:hypothetical protein [Devosia faecipullorum]MBE7734642.1 hypothetical protein [Devosia faecipullorum]
MTLAAWDDLRRASNELDATKAALAAQRESLTTSLTRIGIDAEVLELPALVQAADNALANDSTLRSKRLDADKRIGELDDAAEQRKAALDEAVTGFNEWQSAWEAALAATWFTDQQGSISAVRELLDAIAGLPEVLREQDDLQYRISAMEADQNSFADTVVRLNGALGDMLDVSNPLTAARELIQRHEEARQIEARRQERDQARLELSIERERLDSEVAMHDARKTEMTSFFRVETLADVRLALERCRKRNELVEEQAKLKRQILNDMQAQSLQDALVSLADTDLSELRREQAELVTRIEDLDGRAKDQFADKARASDRLAAIGGDDAVARLEAKRRTLLLEIEDQALRYLRLRSGSLVADFGIRAYREKHRSTMMNRASEAFRLITRDEYIGLATRPDKDREVLIAIMQNGGSKVATELSKGTQFQLYLALRLAGYEEFAAARPSVPFIADDIMETFDEPRSEEVLRLFGQMAEIGQVIYLTHHRHLCEIAAQVVPQVRIHEIS